MIGAVTEALSTILLLMSPFLVGIAWDLGRSAVEDLETILRRKHHENSHCENAGGI